MIAGGALAAVCAMLYFGNPEGTGWALKCPFRLLTGLDCPACGIQRFIHALLHGRPLEALRYNYYLALALPYALLFVVEWALPKGDARRRLASVIEHRYAVWTYVVTFCAWLVIRNIFHL